MLDYLKHFNKFTSSFRRIEFQRKELDYDFIPNFLQFRVPDNGVFSRIKRFTAFTQDSRDVR